MLGFNIVHQEITSLSYSPLAILDLHAWTLDMPQDSWKTWPFSNHWPKASFCILLHLNL